MFFSFFLSLSLARSVSLYIYISCWYFAGTGDLADNHDIVSFKVSDPQGMSAEERNDIANRIKQVCQHSSSAALVCYNN